MAVRNFCNQDYKIRRMGKILLHSAKSIANLLSFTLLFVMSIVWLPNANAANPLQFADYPATEEFSGQPSKIDPSTDDRFRALRPVVQEIIAEDVRKGPNFAGAYRLVEVGCGIACQNIAAIDLRNGQIIWAPIAPTAGVLFQADSRLIIIKADKHYNTPRRYLVLQDSTFKEISSKSNLEDALYCTAEGDAKSNIEDCTKVIMRGDHESTAELAVLYNDRGVNFMELEQYERALADFDKAISMAPEVSAFYMNRGYLHKERGNREAAERDYRKALELAANEDDRKEAGAKLKEIIGQED